MELEALQRICTRQQALIEEQNRLLLILRSERAELELKAIKLEEALLAMADDGSVAAVEFLRELDGRTPAKPDGRRRKRSQCLHHPTRDAVARGCCGSCYDRFREDVATGQTSWEQLEQGGRVKPLQAKGVA